MRDDDIIELQNRLTLEGLYNGPITGYFGPLTRESVKKYQAKNKIIQDGIVGPNTLFVLNKTSTAPVYSSEGTSLKQLVEILISIGVIAPNRADLARIVSDILWLK